MQIYKINQDRLAKIDYEDFLTDKESTFLFILNPDELMEINDHFRFGYHTINDCIHNDDTPKVEIYENYSFGILNIIDASQDTYNFDELDFYLTKKCLLLVTKTDLSIIDDVKKDVFSKGSMISSLDRILYTLLDKMSSKDYEMLSYLEAEIQDVEVDVIEGKTKDYISDIVNLKKKLLFLKKHYEPLLDIIEDITENTNNVLDGKSIAYFIILFNRIERLNRKVGNLRDYVTQIRESYQAQLDLNLNNTMKLFTVITAIFLPLTLIVGWYGMNFSTMPELHWEYGYSFVIALSISVFIICIWFFKKKKLM
ncbi:MAG: Mg2+ transporter protein CorA family protein [Sedimentibacter sp.]|nr:Mg2+ transporter protein CorA family protein [Sedimentibacter sp.]